MCRGEPASSRGGLPCRPRPATEDQTQISRAGRSAIWNGVGRSTSRRWPRSDTRPTHVTIASPDRATVDAFHTAGLAAGGRDNGPPGVRPQYHQDYYGAFVLDPDGNNLEAACHRPS